MEEPSGNSFLSQPVLGGLKRSIIPPQLQQKREVLLAKTKARAKHKLGSTPAHPLSCIFQEPETRGTCHAESKVRHMPGEEKLEKLQQFCTLERWYALQIQKSGERLTPLVLTNPLKMNAFRMQGESLGQRDNKHLQTCPQFTANQSPYWKECILLCIPLSPSLYSQGVTAEDIQNQTRKVEEARKRLAEALEADRLARQVECMNN